MTDLLAAFAPRRVLRHDLLAAGGSWTQTATTLFVDLEGFTPLTERLGTFGSRGTEELSVLLGGFFGAIADAVTDHDGDPIAFGGDALTVLFEGPSGPALEAASSAAAAIGRLVEEVSGASTLGGPLRLRTRIGIARGPVTTGVANSARRSLPVQVGIGLDLAAAAESEAEPGEIVVHPSAREVTRDDPTPPALPSGSRAEPDGLARLLSPWVVDRLERGAARMESHRRITTAFAEFPPVQPDGVTDFLTTVAELLELVDDWEGETVRVSGGDKGVVAMIVFGAPLAHADDPMRAIEAMLRLRDSQPAVAAGVASGPVFAALLGSRSRMFPTYTGLAVTTAARLMQLAESGDLLVDGTTWAESSERLRQRGQPSVRQLKGHSKGVTVHMVDGWRFAPARVVAEAQTPLVDRLGEVAAIEALLDSAATGNGRCIEMCGEPGIGKTRLVEEAIDRALTRGLQVAATDGDAHPRGQAESLWREVLGGLIDVPDVDSAERWRAALSERLPEARGQIGLLGPRLGLALGEWSLPGRHEPMLEDQLAQGLVVQLLETVSRDRPVLFVVDNVDHLDHATRAFVGAVATQLAGSSTSSLLTAAHPGPDTGVALTLSELPAEAARVVAADAWRQAGAGSAPPWLESQVARRAGGNPLYIRTVVWALRDQWEPGSPPPDLGSISEGSLTALLNERIDRLPGADRALVHLLATVRRPCTAEVLADASGTSVDIEAVRDLTAGLAGQRIIEVDDIEGVERIRLVHDILRQSVYESLSHAERDRLHRVLVEVLEAHGADAVEIAEHVRELDDPKLRRKWFPRAAASSRQVWNLPEAVRYLEQVRPLLIGAERERIDVELLEAMLVAGRANDVLAEVRGSGSSTDPLLSARRLHALAEAAFVCGDFNRSEAAARRAMQLTEGRDEQRYQRATELLVLVRIELGDTRGAVAVAQQLLGRTANARDVRAATTARTALGVALYWSGQPEQAAKHYRDALTGAREAGDVVTQVHVLSDLAGCAFETGHHDECIRLLAEARTLADDIGYRRHLAVNLSNEAQLRAVLGDPYVAACAATAIKRSVDMGDLPAAASTLHTWLSATPALAASVDRWARLTQLDASLDRMLAATTDRAELSVVAARAGRREVALEAAAVADAAAHELEQLQLLPRVRLGRLLAARPTDGAPAESFLAALDELASDPDTEDLERAEIALDRWRTTRTEADRRSAVALATKAFDVEPSAVVRAWFTELGELGPEPPAPLPPPVGIGTSETALADIDDAFTLVEAALATSQRSE